MHLERISDFLVCGKGVWWEKNQHGFHFFDGDSELNQHPEGPILYHFNNNTIPQAEQRRLLCWKQAIEKIKPLLTEIVKLYGMGIL